MNDLEFVQRCIATDKQAWDRLVREYSRLIYSSIHGVLKVHGASLAQDNINDIFQDIFVLLRRDDFRKLKTYSGRNGCSLASWLRTVVTNFTIDYLRRRKSTVSLDAEDDDGFSLKDLLADDCLAAPDMLAEEEKFLALRECIDALELEAKYFMELFLNQRLGPEELSEVFKISRHAVDMRKLRIIEKLKECFKGKGFLR